MRPGDCGNRCLHRDTCTLDCFQTRHGLNPTLTEMNAVSLFVHDTKSLQGYSSSSAPSVVPTMRDPWLITNGKCDIKLRPQSPIRNRKQKRSCPFDDFGHRRLSPRLYELTGISHILTNDKTKLESGSMQDIQLQDSIPVETERKSRNKIFTAFSLATALFSNAQKSKMWCLAKFHRSPGGFLLPPRSSTED